MTYDVTMTTTARSPLTRERIIAGAVAFADENGVDSLSMRKLGAVLGVEAMSLYNHVENKDDIYDGMIDYVFASIPLPDDELSWQESVRVIGAAAIAKFTEHSWVVSLLMQRGNFGPGALAFMDQVLGILTEAGFEDEEIHHAWQMLASHTMGYTFQSASNPGVTEREMQNFETQMVLLGEHFPNVARLGPLLAHCQFSSEYMFGLEIIIDGLEARLR